MMRIWRSTRHFVIRHSSAGWNPLQNKKILFVYGLLGLPLLAIGGSSYALFLAGGSGPAASVGSINLQQGLVGWWKLDGNANDSSPYRHNGTIRGTVVPAVDREGKVNGAMNFSGSTASNIDTGYNFPEQNFTVSIWADPDGTGPNTFDNLISNTRDCCSTNSGFQLQFNKTNTATARLWAGGTSPVGYINAPLPLNTWTQLTISYDGSTFKIYANGAFVTSVAYSGTLAAPLYDVLIGGMGSIPNGYTFGGSLDDARIYNRALSAAEVTALYNQYDPGLKAASGQSGLIGEWKMDGNANDSTPNRNNGTVNGATLTADREGRANSAYQLGNSNAYINVGSPSIFSNLTTSGFTYSVWLMRTTTSTNEWPEIMGAMNTHVYYGIRSQSYGNGITFEYANGTFDGSHYTSLGFGGCATPTYGTWHLYTVTYSGSTLTDYCDGAVAATTSSATLNPAYGGLYFSNGGSIDWNGSLDDARVYNRALSPTEVSNLYNSYNSQVSVSNLQSGLVGDWAFNGNAKDSTPYRNNGTVNGATLTTDREGRANSAYSFNGSTNYVALNNINLPTDITASAWVYSSNFSQPMQVVVKNPANAEWELFFTASGVLVWNTSGGYNTAFSCPAPANNAWHMVTATQSGTSAAIYIDGILCKQGTKNAIGNDSGEIDIGRYSGGYYFNGSIDDVRIWNRALSATEVQALYNEYN